MYFFFGGGGGGGGGDQKNDFKNQPPLKKLFVGKLD
jgi:hypothetical protein